jgi:hypothetical protein
MDPQVYQIIVARVNHAQEFEMDSFSENQFVLTSLSLLPSLHSKTQWYFCFCRHPAVHKKDLLPRY